MYINSTGPKDFQFSVSGKKINWDELVGTDHANTGDSNRKKMLKYIGLKMQEGGKINPPTEEERNSKPYVYRYVDGKPNMWDKDKWVPAEETDFKSFDKKEIGGKVQNPPQNPPQMPPSDLFNTNKPAYADSVLTAHKDLDWVKRLYEKNPQSIPAPDGSGRHSSHLMGDNGEGYVYPHIIRENGNLKYMEDENEAETYARRTHTGIQLPKKKGTWFADDGYKQGSNLKGLNLEWYKANGGEVKKKKLKFKKKVS